MVNFNARLSKKKGQRKLFILALLFMMEMLLSYRFTLTHLTYLEQSQGNKLTSNSRWCNNWGEKSQLANWFVCLKLKNWDDCSLSKVRACRESECMLLWFKYRGSEYKPQQLPFRVTFWIRCVVHWRRFFWSAHQVWFGVFLPLHVSAPFCVFPPQTASLSNDEIT